MDCIYRRGPSNNMENGYLTLNKYRPILKKHSSSWQPFWESFVSHSWKIIQATVMAIIDIVKINFSKTQKDRHWKKVIRRMSLNANLWFFISVLIQMSFWLFAYSGFNSNALKNSEIKITNEQSNKVETRGKEDSEIKVSQLSERTQKLGWYRNLWRPQ